MKGVFGSTIHGIGGLLIAAFILLATAQIVGEVFIDKRGETEIATMGIRNTIIQMSIADNGVAIYEMPGEENYTVDIGAESIEVQYSGEAITYPELAPKLKISHYTQNLKPVSLEGGSLCVIKKKDKTADCLPIVEVCLEDEPCCNSAYDSGVC